MKDLIILSGAPGSGKSTTAKILQKKLGSPYIDFGWMREWHLLPDWSNQSQEELNMAFENLTFILENYLKHDYKNIIVTDLREEYVKRLSESFPSKNVLVVTLVVNDAEELRQRVLGKRDSGFKDDKASIEWNESVKMRNDIPGEMKIDNTHQNPEKTAEDIVNLVGL